MQDLILDQMVGKQLISFHEAEDNLVLVFDTGNLVCYHEQDCCESVMYLNSTTDEVGVVKTYGLQEIDDSDDEDIDCSDYSCTMTYLTLDFVSGESNTFIFRGESNGYYSEAISYRWDYR